MVLLLIWILQSAGASFVIPQAFDWRTYRMCQWNPSNQGLCLSGSWALSFAKAFQYHYCVHNQPAIFFSAQELLDCGLNIEKPLACEDFANQTIIPFDYIQRFGLTLQKDYPYNPRNYKGQACKQLKNATRKIPDITKLNLADYDAIKESLVKIGPLVLILKKSLNYARGQHREQGDIMGIRAFIVVGYDKKSWKAIGTLGSGWSQTGSIDIAINSEDIVSLYTLKDDTKMKDLLIKKEIAELPAEQSFKKSHMAVINIGGIQAIMGSAWICHPYKTAILFLFKQSIGYNFDTHIQNILESHSFPQFTKNKPLKMLTQIEVNNDLNRIGLCFGQEEEDWWLQFQTNIVMCTWLRILYNQLQALQVGSFKKLPEIELYNTSKLQIQPYHQPQHTSMLVEAHATTSPPLQSNLIFQQFDWPDTTHLIRLLAINCPSFTSKLNQLSQQISLSLRRQLPLPEGVILHSKAVRNTPQSKHISQLFKSALYLYHCITSILKVHPNFCIRVSPYILIKQTSDILLFSIDFYFQEPDDYLPLQEHLSELSYNSGIGRLALQRLNYLRLDDDTYKLGRTSKAGGGLAFVQQMEVVIPTEISGRFLRTELIQKNMLHIGKQNIKELIQQLDEIQANYGHVFSKQIKDTFHRHGVNLSYLGKVYQQSTQPTLKQCLHLQMLARILKHHSPTLSLPLLSSTIKSLINNEHSFDHAFYKSLQEYYQCEVQRQNSIENGLFVLHFIEVMRVVFDFQWFGRDGVVEELMVVGVQMDVRTFAPLQHNPHHQPFVGTVSVSSNSLQALFKNLLTTNPAEIINQLNSSLKKLRLFRTASILFLQGVIIPLIKRYGGLALSPSSDLRWQLGYLPDDILREVIIVVIQQKQLSIEEINELINEVGDPSKRAGLLEIITKWRQEQTLQVSFFE